MHKHTYLRWNDYRFAECVICGEIIGTTFYPMLTGLFHIDEYNKMANEHITTASTFTTPKNWNIKLD